MGEILCKKGSSNNRGKDLFEPSLGDIEEGSLVGPVFVHDILIYIIGSALFSTIKVSLIGCE